MFVYLCVCVYVVTYTHMYLRMPMYICVCISSFYAHSKDDRLNNLATFTLFIRQAQRQGAPLRLHRRLWQQDFQQGNLVPSSSLQPCN